MGRAASGVKGIGVVGEDRVVGMVVADPEATLLTVCQNGYGKRTPFGPHSVPTEGEPPPDDAAGATGSAIEPGASADAESEEESGSQARYRTQRRGGKGLRDIKTTDRNGPVIGIARVDDNDEVIVMTARGKIQRIAAADISVIGRNTQGVKIMTLDEEDTLAAVVRVPPEERGEADEAEEPAE
jgi:DNA gyrase subunit A